MPRFDRTYVLTVGPVEVRPPLRITFEVEKDASEKPNFHTIRVWNLTQRTRDAVVIPDEKLVLKAGYTEEKGAMLVATGTVTFGYSYFDGPDVVTEIEALDGFRETRDTAITLSYGRGARASAILRDIAGKMGLTLIMASDVPDRTWEHGFSFYGAAITALHKVCSATGLEWSIQNGTLQIVRYRGTTSRTAVVLSAGTGLIGYPERTRLGAREKARVRDQVSGDNRSIVSAAQQTSGWRVTSLLLPEANPGDLVRLESRSVTGLFRADRVRHLGDWGGPGDWTTDFDLAERS